MSLDSLTLYCWESKVQNTIPFWCMQFSLCNKPTVENQVGKSPSPLQQTKHLLVYPGIHACAWVTCFISCLVNPLPKRIGGDEGFLTCKGFNPPNPFQSPPKPNKLLWFVSQLLILSSRDAIIKYGSIQLWSPKLFGIS